MIDEKVQVIQNKPLRPPVSSSLGSIPCDTIFLTSTPAFFNFSGSKPLVIELVSISGFIPKEFLTTVFENPLTPSNANFLASIPY